MLSLLSKKSVRACWCYVQMILEFVNYIIEIEVIDIHQKDEKNLKYEVEQKWNVPSVLKVCYQTEERHIIPCGYKFSTYCITKATIHTKLTKSKGHESMTISCDLAENVGNFWVSSRFRLFAEKLTGRLISVTFVREIVSNRSFKAGVHKLPWLCSMTVQGRKCVNSQLCYTSMNRRYVWRLMLSW